MKIVTADQILDLLKLDKTSDNYQLVYKVGDLIVGDLDDYTVLEKTLERGILDAPKCPTCGTPEEAIYSSNGVFDNFSCCAPCCPESTRT